MLLNEVEKNSRGKILSINTDDKSLKERLRSFGVKINSTVLVKEFSANRSTMSILVGKTVLALREEEAKKIEIEVE